jgi:hypothetical protein
MLTDSDVPLSQSGSQLLTVKMDTILPNTPMCAQLIQLADHVSYKIARLALYMDSSLTALQQVYRHIVKFTKWYHDDPAIPSATTSIPFVFTNGTFKYYAWISHQYQRLAELLELASTHGSLKLPFPKVGATIWNTIGTEVKSLLSLGLSVGLTYTGAGEAAISSSSETISYSSMAFPAMTCQPPGYYYLLAAKCFDLRRRAYSGSSASTIHPFQYHSPREHADGSTFDRKF